MALAKTLGILLALLLAVVTSAHASISRVQYLNTCSSGSATTLSCTYTSNVTAGDTLVVIGAQYGANGNAISIADSAGFAWQSTGSTTSSFASSAAWWTWASSTSAETVTLSGISSGDGSNALLIEYSGTVVPYAYDGSAFNEAGSTSSTQPGNVVVGTGAPDVLVAYGLAEYQANSFTTPSGYTSLMAITNGNGHFAGFDDIGVSAGTYNPTISASTTARSLHVGLLAFKSTAPASGLRQYAVYEGGSSSGSQAFPFPVLAGSTLTAVLVRSDNSVASPTISTFTDSKSNTWVNAGESGPIQNATSSKYFDSSTLYAPNVASGATTVSFTLSATSVVNVLIICEYTGPSTYPLSGISFAFSTSATSLSSGSVNAASGDTLFAWGVNASNSGNPAQPQAPSGYATDAQYPSGNFTAVSVFGASAGSSGFTNPTSTISSSQGGFLFGFMVLRHANPSLGRMQLAPYVASASTAFPQPNLAGDMLVALCGGAGGTPTASVSDTKGNTWYTLPVTGESDSSDQWGFFYAINAVAGANTVTCASPSASIALWEYAGVDTVAPFSGASAFFTDNPSTSSMALGSVFLGSSGILFSVAGNMGVTNGVYTPSSGFNPNQYWYGNDTLQAWDEVASAGSYSNTVTAAAANQYPNGVLLAFGSSTVNYPVLRQHNRASGASGPDTSHTAPFPMNVKSGDLIVAVVANQSGSSPGTTSDSESNTYTLIQGGGSNQYGIWWARASSSGSLSVTNTVSNCIGVMEFDHTTGVTLDQSTTATNASATSIGTGNIATTAANELIIAAGSIISTTSRLYFSSMSAGWSQVLFACGGHYAAYWVGWQSPAPVGTYSNTFTWGGSASPVTASIFSFAPPSTVVVQPNVFIISQLFSTEERAKYGL